MLTLIFGTIGVWLLILIGTLTGMAYQKVYEQNPELLGKFGKFGKKVDEIVGIYAEWLYSR